MNKILLSLLMLVGSSAFAQDVYICDTADGQATVLTDNFTEIKDSFNFLQGGESVLLCRGGSFDKTLNQTLYNSNCSASQPCTLSAYGVGDKPIINAIGTDAIRFSERKQDGGYVISNLHLIGQDGNSGVALSNDVDDVVIDNIITDGFSTGVYLAGSRTGEGGDAIISNITLKNSTILNSTGRGFLGGGEGIVIEDNHFESNGLASKFGHNIYLTNSTKDAARITKDVTIRGNTLYKSAYNTEGSCVGTSLVVHAQVHGLLIEDNIIKEDAGKTTGGCWGIVMTAKNVGDEFKNAIIRNNTLTNMGHTAIGCNSCSGVLIEGNTITGSDPAISNSIAVPAKAGEVTPSKNVIISNNVITQVRADKGAIKLGGDFPFIVTGNVINANECYDLSGANTNTDVSTNICNGGDPVIPPVDPVDPPVITPPPVADCLTGTSYDQLVGVLGVWMSWADPNAKYNVVDRSQGNFYADSKHDEIVIEMNALRCMVEEYK